MKNSILDIDKLEKKLISKNNRFSLKKKQDLELIKKFNHSNVIILGAAGSIGQKFTINFLKFNFKNLYLFDKDENELTELNRKLIQFNKKKINKINFICSDLNDFKFKNFFKEKKIEHILNFAAIKHVRTEENDYSLGYMFKTNCINFLNFKFNKELKTLFSISTDKVIKPTSMLGVSKRLMEFNLGNIKKSNKSINVCSVRFTNVSFSKGSILKNIIDRLSKKEDIGIPKNIKRYFITHSEAVSLCLKSLLNESKNSIILPSSYVVDRPHDIKSLCLKILSITKAKFHLENLKKKNKKSIKLVIQDNITQGQKAIEDLKFDEELYLNYKNDSTIIKTPILTIPKINSLIKKYQLGKNKKDFLFIAKKIYNNFKFNKKSYKVSKIL